MGKRGPESKIETDPELEKKILLFLRRGNYVETAAAAAGVSRNTLYRWMRDRPDFRERIQQACAFAEVTELNRIKKAAESGNLQASLWRLERRWPERWGRRDRPQVPEDELPLSGVVILPPTRPIENEVETQPLVHEKKEETKH